MNHSDSAGPKKSDTRPGSASAWPARILFCLALLAAASMAYYHLGLFMPRVMAVRAFYGGGNGYSFGDDFYPVWLTTRTWRSEHLDLYGAEMTRKIQTGLFGRPIDPKIPTDPPANYRQFAYPAFTDLLFWPAALIDFPRLRILLAVLLPLLTFASLAWWLRALQWDIGRWQFGVLALLTLSSYQLLEAFFAEQPGLFCGFFLAAAALALRRNRLLLSGALMALTLIKPQMTLLAIGYLLLWSFAGRHRARFRAGFFGVAIPLMAASLWIWPNWVAQWLGVVSGYHRYAMPPLILVLLGPSLGRSFGPVLIAGAVLAGIAVAWRNRNAGADAPRFWLTLSLLLAITSISMLPGQAVYDHIVLIPGILLVVRYRRGLRSAGRVPRVLLTAGTLVFVWPWISAFILLMLRPLLPTVDSSTNIFTLPIRSAAPLPFAALALIAYAMHVVPTGEQKTA